MATKKNQDIDLFGTEYNPRLKELTNKYASKVPLANSLFFRFQKFQIENDWKETPSQSEFFEKFFESYTELKTQLQSTYKPYYAQVINHSFSTTPKYNITVKIGFIDFNMECLWDTFSMNVDDPLMCYCLLSTVSLDKVSYAVEAPQPLIPWKKPKLYRFHPERFSTTRKYAKAVVEIYKNEINTKHGFLTLSQVNHVASEVANYVNVINFKYPLKLRKESNPSLVMDSEMALAMSYARFVAAGKQIFQFSSDLTEMLNNTGNDDIQMGNIRLPYNSLYLHFGPQDHLALDNGWLVDGAYIETRGDDGNFKITLTSVPLDIENAKYWFLKPEPIFHQDIVGDYADKNLKEVISILHKDTIERIASTKPLEIEDKKLTEIVPNIIDVSEVNAMTRLGEAERKFPIYQSALTLIINALCYITSYRDDIEYKYTDDVPKILLDSATSTKQQKKADEKLKNDGYSKVHICGENLFKKAGIATHQRTVGIHWRRGHWRKQPYGEKRSQTKLKWIMPMLVGAKTSENDSPRNGHIYDIKPSETH